MRIDLVEKHMETHTVCRHKRRGNVKTIKTKPLLLYKYSEANPTSANQSRKQKVTRLKIMLISEQCM